MTDKEAGMTTPTDLPHAFRPELRVADSLGPDPRQKYDWDWIADQVRQNPDQWVCVGTFSSATGTRIKRGEIPLISPDEFEVTMRKSRDSKKKSGYLLWLKVK